MSAQFKLETNVALLTKHAKQDLIAPIFRDKLKTSIICTDKFDTDTLGTFDNAIARTLSPKQAALKKAYLACEYTGCSQGLGSEGSFNSMMGLGVVDDEVLAFVDLKNNLEVVASASQLIGLDAIEAQDESELKARLAPFVKKYGESQRWMLQLGDKWLKGLRPSEISQQVQAWPLRLDPDFRAMHCPPRQQVIAMAANDLVLRLQSECPTCHHINFVQKHEPNNPKYLPCELCSLPTTKLALPPKRCEQCGFVEQNTAAGNNEDTASAMYCSFCNP